MDGNKAIILFGHGSRDPLWRQPMDAVAQRIGAQQPQRPVRCAFLELQAPDLATVVSELVALGVRELVVVPMFLGVGRHAREDLPALLESARVRHPDVSFEMQPTVGEDPALLDLLAKIAMA
jgi:sirohydrochlorin cobaltochelatase